MPRSAQARLDAASRLGVDDDDGMERAHVAAIRRGDKARSAAYRKGQDAGKSSVRDRRGGIARRTAVPEIYDPDDAPDEHGAYHQGVDDAVADERRAGASELFGRARNSRPGLAFDDGAGFLLGLLGYALFLAYVRDGPAGVKGWLKAKFLNDASASKGATKNAPKQAPSGGAATPRPGSSFAPPLPWGTSPGATSINASLPVVFATTRNPVPISPLVGRGPG